MTEDPLSALDQICLTGVRGTGHHGVFEHERRDGQEFVVDVVLGLDTRAAADGDDLGRTAHYGEVAQRVHDLIAGDPVDLIETLAERIAQACLAFPGVQVAEVVVHKPQAPIPVPFDDVAVRIRRVRPPRRGRAALALGANLGDRAAALQGAVDLLCAAEGVTAVAVSPVYETDPVGGPEQPAYLNAVLVVDTDLDPDRLLALAHDVERAWDRTREVRWGPRTLDVDLLAVGDVVLRTESLQLPHPRAHERAFVLVPWAQVDPQARVPGLGTVSTLAAAVTADGVRRRDDIDLHLPGAGP